MNGPHASEKAPGLVNNPSCTFAPGAASATASPQPAEVREYEQDFGVSQDIAEKNLETQERGAGIVGELKAALGKRYAGVWFDNKTGEFIIPTLPNANRAAISSQVADDGLIDNYHTVPAVSSWEELEAAQTRINQFLQNQIKARLVLTSLDPHANAVVIRKTNAMSKAEEVQLQLLATSEHAVVQVRPQTEPLSFELRACKTTSPRACGRPLRGGVSLTPEPKAGLADTGECSAAFKAIGNTYGNRYMLTAGHCAAKFPERWASEDASGNPRTIGPVEEYRFPGGDWAKIKANGSAYWDVSPWPSEVAHYWEDQERPINFEAWSYVGEYVCISGTRSGTSCGSVFSLDVTGESGQGNVYHQTEFGPVCIKNGDSGGSVFAGNTALGIFSGSDVTGCTAIGVYSEIVEATSAMGVSVGTRIGGLPSATTSGATNIQASQATANGEVNPNSVETHYRFEYGTTMGYGSSLPAPDGSVGHGTGTVGLNLTLPNLLPGTTYHYRLVATSAAGTSYGSDVSFSTPLMPTPEAVVDESGNEHVYARSANGQLSEWYQEGTSWRHKLWGYANMVTGTPSAVTTSGGNIWVYYRGTDNVMHRWWFNGPNWDEHQYGYAIVAGNPSAVTTSGGNIWVYYRGTDNVMHRWWFNGPNWDEHQYGYAIVAGNPSAVTTSGGNIWVYYRGTDNVMHRWWFNGPNWDEHQYGYAIVTNDPSAATTSDGSIWVYYRGSDGVMHRWWFNGPNWDEHQYGYAIVAGNPSAITTSDGSIWVYYRGTDWVLHRWWFNGPNWDEHQYGYAELGGDPSAVAGPSGSIDAFYVDRQWNLRHWWFKGQDWSLETIGSVN
jgi:hypothetical protein